MAQSDPVKYLEDNQQINRKLYPMLVKILYEEPLLEDKTVTYPYVKACIIEYAEMESEDDFCMTYSKALLTKMIGRVST